ncbi:hypothetical protein HY627_01610 [Candidatus Uhrbacteria bacterium]|nr:hypothetical protein [Candidatus Uhrbacteria bacterium]
MYDIERILQSLGFLESEIKTYLSSLHHGPSTVLELTKYTNLSRQATYAVIDALTARGVMSSVMRGKKKYYVAEDPEKLLSYAKRKEAEMRDRLLDLERMLPELKLKVGGEKPVVKVFEGKDGYRTVVDDIIASKSKHIVEILDIEAKKKVVSKEESHAILTHLRKAGVTLKGLYSGKPHTWVVQGERIFLPKEEGGFKSCILLYGERIALFTYEGKMYSIIIESKALADALRLLFSYAFKGSNELEKHLHTGEAEQAERNIV